MADPFVNDVELWTDKSGRKLSRRLWLNRQTARKAIDDVLRQGIRDGATIEDVANDLLAWVRPSYRRYGRGKAQHAANRLASNEINRAHAQAEQQVSMTDPAGGYLRYRTADSHILQDECDDRAERDTGYGPGIYLAQSAPLPPEHVNCRCRVEQVTASEVSRRDIAEMDDFVEQLRVEYGLADPPDLSPAELAEFRRQTAQIRQDVVTMFGAWFDQAGIATYEQVTESSPTVKAWIVKVEREKRQRRG